MVDQRANGGAWIAMQTVKKATGFLCFFQEATMLLIDRIRHLLYLVEQLFFAFSEEQNLMLAEISERSC